MNNWYNIWLTVCWASESSHGKVEGWTVVGLICGGLFSECMLISLILDGERSK